MVKKMLSVMEQMLWLCGAEAGAAVVLDTGSHRLGNTCSTQYSTVQYSTVQYRLGNTYTCTH